MKRPVARGLFWMPSVLCMLFALFVSLFALDVFGEGYGFWETIWALLMHLIPTAIILVVLAHWTAYLFISGPLFLIGVLFLINWRYRAEIRAAA